jgi:hypothetical protein
MTHYLTAAGVRIVIPYIVAVEPLDRIEITSPALKITTVGGAHQFTFESQQERDDALLRITAAINQYYEEREEKRYGNRTGERQAEGVREGPAGEEGHQG